MNNIDKTQFFDKVNSLKDLTGEFNSVNNSDLETAVSSLPSDSAMLVSTKGANAGARYLLNKEKTTIGRDNGSSDIFLDDFTVSRNHAQIGRKENNKFFIIDDGSLNGTYVNLERIYEQELKTGDVVHIGKFQLTFYSSKESN